MSTSKFGLATSEFRTLSLAATNLPDSALKDPYFAEKGSELTCAAISGQVDGPTCIACGPEDAYKASSERLASSNTIGPAVLGAMASTSMASSGSSGLISSGMVSSAMVSSAMVSSGIVSSIPEDLPERREGTVFWTDKSGMKDEKVNSVDDLALLCSIDPRRDRPWRQESYSAYLKLYDQMEEFIRSSKAPTLTYNRLMPQPSGQSSRTNVLNASEERDDRQRTDGRNGMERVGSADRLVAETDRANLLKRPPAASGRKGSAVHAPIFRDMMLHVKGVDPMMLERTLDALKLMLRLYSPEASIVGFNGGKDASVAMHLTAASVANYYRIHNTPPDARIRPRAVFFAAENEEEFPEIVKFVWNQTQRADLALFVYKGPFHLKVCPFLKTLHGFEPSDWNHLEWNKHACFVLGVRYGDPGTSFYQTFQPSNDRVQCPIPFMRVHPILEWTYGMVWGFLTSFELPYCELYDRGYTSLGALSKTKPNDALKLPGGEYRAAKDLEDWSSERSARVTGN